MPDKDEVIDAEVVSEKEVPEENKDNAFKKFWKKTKQSVNDAVLENKIETNFNKSNTKFSIYTKDDMFSKTVFGSITNDVLTVFGEQDLAKGAIVINEVDQKAYKIVETAKSTCHQAVEGVEYERPATAITLTDKVTEVKVIKAGKRYFLDEE